MELTQQHFDQVVKTLVTKDDLLELATKADLKSLSEELKRISAKLEAISKRSSEDDAAAFKDLEKLKVRVQTLEKSFKEFKLQHS